MGKSPKITIDIVKDEFNKIGYAVLTDVYVNAKTKFNAVCNHGHTYETSWTLFQIGCRCKECRKVEAITRLTKTHEQFVQEVLEWGNGEYEVLTKYEHNAKKVKLLHKKCENIFEMQPNSFKQGQRCPICAKKLKNQKQTKTQEQFELEIKKLVGTDFTVLGKYSGNKVKMLFRHNICGYEFERTPVKFLTDSHNCPKCNHIILDRTTESLKKEIELLTNKEYTLLSKYVNMKTKVRIRHNNCEHEWLILPDSFINGGIRCPRCSSGKTERSIATYLQKNYIEFKTQYRIKECKNIRPLPFDFAIFNHGKLVALVEYDGEQHYIPFHRSTSEKAKAQLAKTQYNDKIKNEYCKKHHINLIRIPYWYNHEIEKHLEEQLAINHNEIQLALII